VLSKLQNQEYKIGNVLSSFETYGIMVTLFTTSLNRYYDISNTHVHTYTQARARNRALLLFQIKVEGFAQTCSTHLFQVCCAHNDVNRPFLYTHTHIHTHTHTHTHTHSDKISCGTELVLITAQEREEFSAAHGKDETEIWTQ
jgi:hypothetical protein